MRFMMLLKSDAKAEAGVLPDEALLAAMGNYNRELIEARIMLGGEGLRASSHGARVRITGGKTSVLDGPFAEAKELVAGYWLIQVTDKEQAVEWAKRIPCETGEVEIRALYELEDFPLRPGETADDFRAKERSLRETPAPARKPGSKRYVSLLKADPITEAGGTANDKLMAEMGTLMEEMHACGAMLGGEGLQPSSKGTRVRFNGAKRVVLDGPFTESKELVAGFAVYQAATKAEAVEWARRCLQVHVDGTGTGHGEIEVRQVFELDDFPIDTREQPEGWRKQQQEFRARTGQ
jgi:hypothetical protein